MPEIIIVKAVQTCGACPSQWDAWDLDGRYWYLRYRWDHGTMGRNYLEVSLSFDTGGDGYGGFIALEEFLERIGVTYAPEFAEKVTEFEEAPEV